MKKYKYSEKEQILFLKGFEIKREVHQSELNFSSNIEKTRTYTLKSLEDVYREGKVKELTPEQFKRLNKIVNGIAAKRNGWLQMPKEEVIGELWVKSYEVIGRCGDFNPSVVARSLWNRLNDIFRLGKRVRDKTVLSSEWIEKVETEEKDSQSLSIEDDNTSGLYIQDMMNLFEKDSEELKYLKALMFQIGLDEYLLKEDIDHLKEFENKILEENERLKQRKETKIARYMGFKTDSAVGYRTIKEKVRQILIDNGYRILKS